MTSANSMGLEVMSTSWSNLQEHLQRDALVWVSADLDLFKVAQQMADDDKQAIESYLGTGQLCKPNKAQQELWDAQLDKGFNFIIVQPFVLFQESRQT